LLKALDRHSRRTIAWVTGHRDLATVQKLYSKLQHLKQCTFYTDDWKAFASVLPPERHVIGKEHTQLIESDNSNTRHCLARFTRRTKVVSRSQNSVEQAIKLWTYAQQPQLFTTLANVFQTLFK